MGTPTATPTATPTFRRSALQTFLFSAIISDAKPHSLTGHASLHRIGEGSRGEAVCRSELSFRRPRLKAPSCPPPRFLVRVCCIFSSFQNELLTAPHSSICCWPRLADQEFPDAKPYDYKYVDCQDRSPRWNPVVGPCRNRICSLLSQNQGFTSNECDQERHQRLCQPFWARSAAGLMQVVCKSSAVIVRGFSSSFHFTLLRFGPGVEYSETILLRRLMLRLINQISLLSSLAYERTPHPAPVSWRRDYMFRLNHHDRWCVGTFRRTISCAIVEFQTQSRRRCRM
jgi:hypothetical protein